MNLSGRFSLLQGGLLVLCIHTLFISFTLSIPIDNGLVGSEIRTECMNGKLVDLLFVLDGSGSIGGKTFEKQKSFIISLINRLDISENSTRVAVLQFSDEAKVEMSLGKFSNAPQLTTAINKIKYLSGTTLTGQALELARSKGFAGARGPTVRKIIVVITDGQAQDDVGGPAMTLKNDGIIIFAVGVTNLINVDELNLIAGSPQRVFTVESFDKLDDTLSALITREFCKTTIQGGIPEVICQSDSIGVRAKTRNPFEGNVFVKGFFHTQSCRMSAISFATNPTVVGLTVPFNDCGVRRFRSLNPRGFFVETTVVFSFHPTFLTKVDQAVKIQCFYMEANKTVDTDLDVSPLTTRFATQNVPMPVCLYTLHEGSPDGPLVKYATVGESIFHRWECIQQSSTHDIFGMLVHSCFVEDGGGNRVKILDTKGCGLDRHLLGTPEYNDTLRLAHKETHVFKFADKPMLQFQCQITVCIKYDNGCVGVTPPICNSQRFSRQIDVSDKWTDTLDVTANIVTVFEEDAAFEGFPQPLSKVAHSSQTCLNYFSFLLIVGFVVLTHVIIVVNVIYHCKKRKQNVLK